MRFWILRLFLLAVGVLSVQCTQIGPPPGVPDRIVDTWGPHPQDRGRDDSGPELRMTSGNPAGGAPVSSSRLMREVNLKVDMVARGKYGRRVYRPLHPQYITIHSTENYSADARKHAEALKHGALRSGQHPGGNRIGFLIWHYTVDQRMAIQHMPTSEQGEHADFDGPGNRLSIGIEMCENRGADLNATIERTAKLTACLMAKYGIPISHVVPHYHWPRHGKHPPNKNCPHFLMDHGQPGAKWRWFQGKVNYYYQRILAQQSA